MQECPAKEVTITGMVGGERRVVSIRVVRVPDGNFFVHFVYYDGTYYKTMTPTEYKEMALVQVLLKNIKFDGKDAVTEPKHLS